MRDAIVIGTGGHSRVVVSLLAQVGEHRLLGLVDLRAATPGEVIMGARVLGSVESLEALTCGADIDVFLALGDNAARRTWWEKATQLGLPLPNLISPHAVIDPQARLGGANVVCARAFIGPGAVIGDNNLINTAAIAEHEAAVGNHCHLAPASIVAGRCRLGDDCFLGAAATLIDYVHVVSRTTIGAGATVIRNITEPGGVYVGVPAKRLI